MGYNDGQRGRQVSDGQRTLRDAFQNTKNVILIFSVNKSSHYQGFARMCSGSGKSTSNIWRNTENIKLAPNFKVEWITYACLNINRFGDKTNPLNNNESIKKSRDTQELPSDLGKEICLKFMIPLKEDKVPENEADEDGKSEELMMIDPSDFWKPKHVHLPEEGSRRVDDPQRRIGQAKKRKPSITTPVKEDRPARHRKDSSEDPKVDAPIPITSRLVLHRKKSTSEGFKPTGLKDKPVPERRRSKERFDSKERNPRRSRSKSKDRHRERDRDRDRHRNKRSRSREQDRNQKDKFSSKHKYRRD